MRQANGNVNESVTLIHREWLVNLGDLCQVAQTWIPYPLDSGWRL